MMINLNYGSNLILILILEQQSFWKNNKIRESFKLIFQENFVIPLTTNLPIHFFKNLLMRNYKFLTKDYAFILGV